MNTTLKTLAFLLVILAAINSNAQHIIRYEENIYNTESYKLLFVDTTRNQVVDSFYLHEHNPYYYLPYNVVEEGGNMKLKTYNFQNIDSLTKNDIPGLIAYGEGNISRYPDKANPRQRAYLSTNKQFVVVKNSFEIYTGHNEGYIDHASYIVTYRADGSIYDTFYSKDQYIDYIYITEDGNYYLISGWVYDVNAPHGSLKQWIIINIRNNQEVLAEQRSNDNLRGLYGLVYGNYILLMQGVINENDKYGPIVNGYLRCFDMANNLVFSTLIDPKSTSFSMFKWIAKEGVYLKSLQGKDEPDRLLRFDKDFTKQPIR